jgi:hypothetical protein
MRRLALVLLFAVVTTAGHPALAADANATVAPPRAVSTTTTVVTTPTAVEAATIPSNGSVIIVTKPEPHVPYGCKRIWRCDKQVCEWRRGCWGVYGYMEGPYFSQELAQRQWERDGWPVPGSTSTRNRKVVTPSVAK